MCKFCLGYGLTLRKLKLTCKSRLEQPASISFKLTSFVDVPYQYHEMFCHDHHINNLAHERFAYFLVPSVFRWHNRLVPGWLASQCCRASLLSGGGGIFAFAFATED